MNEESKLRDYMEQLEKKILIPGIYSGIFNVEIKIPTRPQKLLFSEFGDFVQAYVEDKRLFVIDYYGLTKKSLGFLDRVEELIRQGIETKSIISPVAYFSGVKIEHLSENAPELLKDFSLFKSLLVRLRKFPDKFAKS